MKNCEFLLDLEFSGEIKDEEDDFDEPEQNGERTKALRRHKGSRARVVERWHSDNLEQGLGAQETQGPR